jgi:hypothetical protein
VLAHALNASNAEPCWASYATLRLLNGACRLHACRMVYQLTCCCCIGRSPLIRHHPVQVMDPGSQQGVRELRTEVDVLSRVHHPHVLLLLGACTEPGRQALVLRAHGGRQPGGGAAAGGGSCRGRCWGCGGSRAGAAGCLRAAVARPRAHRRRGGCGAATPALRPLPHRAHGHQAWQHPAKQVGCWGLLLSCSRQQAGFDLLSYI